MSKSVLFVNSNIKNYQMLLTNLQGYVDVYVLNANEDGVLQIAGFLRGRTGLDSIQILSHGSSGSLALGSDFLTADNVSLHADALKQIGSSLTEAGDILLYGCDIAQGDTGQAFIQQLASLTGADVAASTNLTGAGGDWLLEAQTGGIETPIAIDTKAQLQYVDTLSTTTTNPLNALLTLNDGYPAARWNFTNAVGSSITSPAGLGCAATITYSFLTFVPAYYSNTHDPITGFVPFTSEQQQAARNVLASIASVANLTFTEVSGIGNITFGMTTQAVGDVAYAYSPSFSYTYSDSDSTIISVTATDVAGDEWFNSSIAWIARDFTSLGESGYGALVHELGHALGLKHPFEASEDGYFLDASLDNKKYTVMSYTPHPYSFSRDTTHPTPNSYSWFYDYVQPETLMPLDIQALQYLYGANTSYHSGNDTYTFDTARPFIKTIWDGGGNDTISIANFTLGCSIDLRAGAYSSIRTTPLSTDTYTNAYNGTDNLAIAYGTIIENAIGGSGDDVFIGNSANNMINGGAGNDIINGGSGADSMIGGAGNDGYYVDNVADVIVETAYAGSVLPQQWDYVYSSTPSYTLSANVEALVLVEGSAATTAVGNTGYNYFVGNSAADIFDGKGGGDFMVGGKGNDTYNAYNSYDTIIEYAGEGWDTVWAMNNYALSSKVEALLFYSMAGNSSGYGNNDINYLVGNIYNNLLDGQGGNDSLVGSNGSDTLVGSLGQDYLDFNETVASTDTLRIATGDSTVGFGNYDFAVGFKLGTGTVSTAGVDQLDLVNTSIAANAAAVNGTNAGAIMSHSISNGIISFASSDTYATAPLALTEGYLSGVFSYLQANITGSQTVGFVCSGNTYVFQDAGVTDTLVELVGVVATSLNNTGLAANSVWIV
jgi:serralysin